MAKAKKKTVKRLAGLPPVRPIRLLLVADSGTARLLRVTGTLASQKLTEIALLELPAAHLKNLEMLSDKTGRVFDRARGGQGPRSTARHGAASDFDPHTVAYERFAKLVAQLLDVKRRGSSASELVIIAPPRFLGLLRPQLSKPTQKIVVRELAREMVRATDAQLLRISRD
jgi:protein required for attachment to host cells